MKLLNAVTATGASTSSLSTGKAHSSWGLQVKHTGTPTTCVVVVQGSNNASDWFTVLTWTAASETNGDVVFATGKPCLYARLNLTTLSGGSSPTVSAWLSAY